MSIKRLILLLPILCVIIFANSEVFCQIAFERGIKLTANGDEIDIEHGSVVPCVTDWNGDGNKDLIVGQFVGKIRLYLNVGTDANPEFSDFSNLCIGGKDLRVPAG